MSRAWTAALAALGLAHAVCAGAAEERFKLLAHASWRGGGSASQSNAPEVLDRRTRLVWRRTLSTSGTRNPGPSRYDTRLYFTWDEAQEAARFVLEATGEPWRLPTIAELEGMFRAVREEHLDERGVFAFAPPRPSELRQVWFWSGTPHKANPRFAWYINSNFGKPNYYYREYQGRMNLVRAATRADFEAARRAR
jgi:hypothetical protein